jgi:hypothetical protein
VVEIPELPLGFPTPAPRPDGQVLVVGARCQWRSSGPDHNAVVYDHTGQPILDGVFGDGIAHVYTTATGQAWVGYFDEGVFGNRGWGRPGPAPLGATGIVHFDTDLRPQWSFPESTSMADCYSLNVDSWAVWACYYTDFPVARIVNGGVTHWANVAARGANALLVAGTRCVLVGGYNPADRGRLLVGDLDRDAFRPREERRLDLPDHPVRLIGRSDQLHIFHGPHWYKVDTQL